MVTGCRDVGGRCIKARGLPELSQQPGAVTKPPELGRDAPGRRIGPGDPGQEGRLSGDSQQRTAARAATAAARAKLFQPHRTVAAAPGLFFFFLISSSYSPSPRLLPLPKGKKKKEGRKEARKEIQICHHNEKRGGKEKKRKSRDCWGCTHAAGPWAERCGAARPSGRELRLEPRCTARRGEEPDGTPSPKESRRREGCPEETEAARRATGRGDGAGEAGSERAHLVASARSCPSPFSIDTNTFRKGGKPKQRQQSTRRPSSRPPFLPSLPPRPAPAPSPRPTAGAQRVPTRCAMPAV